MSNYIDKIDKKLAILKYSTLDEFTLLCEITIFNIFGESYSVF